MFTTNMKKKYKIFQSCSKFIYGYDIIMFKIFYSNIVMIICKILFNAIKKVELQSSVRLS